MMIPSNTAAELVIVEELDCSMALEEDVACSLDRGMSLLEETSPLEEASLLEDSSFPEDISLLDAGSGVSPLADVESSPQAASQSARQHVERMCLVIRIISSVSFKNKQKEN